MRTLLLGVLLGFLTHGQSVPVNDVTEIPALVEVDVLREAITDGFIVDRPFVPSVLDELSKRNSTSHTDVVVQLPDTLHPTSDPEEESTQNPSEETDMIEASAEGSADYPMPEEQEDGEKLNSSPTPSHPPTLSSSYTALRQKDSEHFISSSSSTQSVYPSSSPSAMPDVDDEDLFIEETTKSPTTMDYGDDPWHPNLQGGKMNSFDALFSTTTTNGPYLRDEPKSSFSPSHSSVSHNTEVPVHRLDSSLTTLSPSSISSVVPSHSPVSESEDEKMLGLSPDTSFSTTSSSSLTLSSSSISGVTSDVNTKEDAPAEASTTTMPPTSTAGVVANTIRGIFMEMEGSGSGEASNTLDPLRMAPPTREKAQTRIIQEIAKGPLLSADQQTPVHQGRSTPGWLIILAFVVALAALVLLCIAIATRDRWNAPKQTCQKKQQQEETKTTCSNQQRELEMETFLNRERPRENGHEEYTVIPLEELPENDPLH